MLKFYRNKIVISAFTLLSVFLLRTEMASAAHQHAIPIYRAQLRADLAGDHLPETATIRQWGSIYQVSIHFTTGRPKLRLRTIISSDMAGLSLQTADIDNDSLSDLVVLSATSTRPVAVWLNRGSANFQRVKSWPFGTFGPYKGPTLQHHGTDAPEPLASLSASRFPCASVVVSGFAPGQDLSGLIAAQPAPIPFDSMSRQLPSRGPPATVRV
jgi:hypothetical protein